MRRLFAKFARTSVKKVVQRERRLGFEACEERQLMTVSPVNLGAIAAPLSPRCRSTRR